MIIKKLALVSITGFCTLALFQNCQRAKMESVKKDDASLARVNETDLGLPPAPAPAPLPDPSPAPTPTPEPHPVCPTDNGDQDSNSVSDDDSHDHSQHSHYKSSYGHEMCDDHSSDDNSGDDCEDHDGQEQGKREYICDISKPGNDHAIGITENESLEVKHQGVKLLCMSKQACEVIAARAFPGAKAEPRGFCKVDNNKNVKHVSDDRMEQLVNKYISEQPAP